MLKIEKKFEAKTEKLQEICESFSKRVTTLEEKVSNLEKTIHGKVVVM